MRLRDTKHSGSLGQHPPDDQITSGHRENLNGSCPAVVCSLGASIIIPRMQPASQANFATFHGCSCQRPSFSSYLTYLPTLPVLCRPAAHGLAGQLPVVYHPLGAQQSTCREAVHSHPQEGSKGTRCCPVPRLTSCLCGHRAISNGAHIAALAGEGRPRDKGCKAAPSST